jgi:hypothetical protein
MWNLSVEVANFYQQGPVYSVVLTGLTGVGQWTRGLMFRCVLRSEDCVLVPRSTGTPMATWAWPIWVVSRRRVLEVVFILLEFPSPSRRIFIGSHSLPPSLVRRIGPSCTQPTKPTGQSPYFLSTASKPSHLSTSCGIRRQWNSMTKASLKIADELI